MEQPDHTGIPRPTPQDNNELFNREWGGALKTQLITHSRLCHQPKSSSSTATLASAPQNIQEFSIMQQTPLGESQTSPNVGPFHGLYSGMINDSQFHTILFLCKLLTSSYLLNEFELLKFGIHNLKLAHGHSFLKTQIFLRSLSHKTLVNLQSSTVHTH